MKRILQFGVEIAIIVFAIKAVALDGTSYDLKRDFLTNSNPNGVWTYRAGSHILPAFVWGDSLPSPQPSWGDPSAPPTRLPAWFQSVNDPLSGLDWKAGDVIVHTQDDLNGAGNGQANVVWTSPFTGTVRISGAVWMGRDIGRANNWNLYVRSTAISGGSISSGDAYDRLHPFTFDTGSGGSNVLQNVQVSSGDQIMLELDRTSMYGDYVGVNLTITQTIPDLNLSITPACYQICYQTGSNLMYQVQYSTSANTNWVPLDTNYVQGDGTIKCAVDNPTNDEKQKFYRVVVTNSTTSP